MYPNPNNGTFVIQSSQEGTYSILNELGQILQTVVLNSTNNFTMNVESLNAGVYILTGLSNKSVIYKRIVVSK
ncbi:MAG: T9SS type A sorting domain-containing protein [Bacteroidetes bacterium]|nr:T9SS type A sorting domain-containing protein [Bacteroidota bacterium]